MYNIFIHSYPLKVEHFFAHVMIMKATESTYCSFGQGNDVWGSLSLLYQLHSLSLKDATLLGLKKKKHCRLLNVINTIFTLPPGAN